ncbi:MAG: 2-oxoglutarate dehydrogenase E1 component [Pikeienuella sp.]
MKPERNDRGAAEAALPIGQDNGHALTMQGRYLRDPMSVPADWRLWFETLDAGERPPAGRADELIIAFREDGHLAARLDPLSAAAPAHARLDRLKAGAGREPVEWTLGGRPGKGTAGELVRLLEQVYCGGAALESRQIEDAEARDWLAERFERAMLEPPGADDLARAFRGVGMADAFESFVRLKFPTKKRFGSEGAEGALLVLREIIRHAALGGAEEIVMGGMHRGRLATLATVLGKNVATLLAEIKGRDLTEGGPDYTGDVPYHLGHVTEAEFDGHPVRLSIAPHPSHLMVVGPVATGLARARRQVGAAMCLLMHTDAAFAGQGLTAELAQLSRLDGYDVGGTIHLVVNNQIGFTTSPSEGRPARYCTDIAKLTGAPALHVNGCDPAALLAAAAVAADWRRRYARDIFIDVVCYRRNGHNELDEPRFTQPRIWAGIDARPAVAQGFRERLQERAPERAATVEREIDDFQAEMRAAFDRIDAERPNSAPDFQPGWAALPRPTVRDLLAPVATGLPLARLREIGLAASRIDPALKVHPKVEKFYALRRRALEDGEGLDFASAEALAFASLIAEGGEVRLTGQDSLRGTFTQRHLRVFDQTGPESAMPLGGPGLEVHNSPLSEYAALGFEYGHSLSDPGALTIWEAQFGDFLNGAQIVVDQYIATAEAKWGLRSGLVVLLPHGLEGQGPDHSSCRPERILQACANGALIFANPTTPANYFHMLRRQLRANWRKPLFIAAPKSLLRAPAARSALAEFGEGAHVRATIYDGPAAPERLALCSGKIAHELAAMRREQGLEDRVGVLRIEQLYPLDLEAVAATVTSSGAKTLVWCQEEPLNQGAWRHIRDALMDERPDLAARLGVIARPAMPAAAGGSIDRHEAEQAALIRRALGLG